MFKPTQARLNYDDDAQDKFTALDDAMTSIASAMESLKGYGDFTDWFDALGEIFDEMKPDCEMYENIAGAEYQAELEDLTRDYYRSVL